MARIKVEDRLNHIRELKDQLASAQAREAELMADNARLRGALNEAHETIGDDVEPYEVAKRRIEALAATPEQSLARIRNEALESAAKVCDEYAEREIPIAACAATIRAMKEPE